MRCVLDTSFFFYNLTVDGELYTTQSVIDELKDLRSKSRFDVLCAQGLTLAVPLVENTEKVKAASKKSGDAGIISDTDCDILALALDLEAVLWTDDFAIQNVASILGVQTAPIIQRKAKRIHWKYRCSGCGRYFDHDGECLICGSIIKRKLK
jgi:endoribonuclease Nob1